MSDIQAKIQHLQKLGVFCARQAEGIEHITNLEEWELEELTFDELEEFMNRMSQHVIYLYQELNKAKAIENATGNVFKRKASPIVRRAPKDELSGRSSVEERWIYASLQTEELSELYEVWQGAVEDVMLYCDLPQAYTEKLNVLKKVHASRSKEKRELVD